MKIVSTDNFGRDYPDEKLVENLPHYLTEKELNSICDILNRRGFPDIYPRYWKVVPDDYILQPGFEP